MERLEICLLQNNSRFANIHLLQTNGTAVGAPNSCSYFDIGYSKSTNSHLYLEPSSCHTKSSKNGIIKGVGLCLLRTCSTME